MLPPRFDPATAEQRIYDGWERAGAFAAHVDSAARPFTIMVPPPNVTGSLHVGHSFYTLQDVLIRFHRMRGRDALWQPGTDHAGIATQVVVEKLLAQSGGPDRKALGREAFLERVWQWKAESGGTIGLQLRRLGASLDWGRDRFTMDAGLSAAVRRVFVTLHGQGLIYRDRRLVNWDPQFQSAISDLEVENREQKGHIWRLRYPIEGAPGRFIVVATTRPETMLGDTAVAVHPDDARHVDLIGRSAIVPLVGRRVPIIADTYSDPEKGTGAVKITPAHDFNDFQVGQRHGLAMPSVLDRQARIALDDIEAELAAVDGIADPGFVRALAGQGRYAARAAIVAELDRLGLLEAVEPHTAQVPHGDRSGVPIEPLLTTQWFCNAAALARPAIAAVENGRTVFVPRQWENTFFAWMRDIQPWCISRQLWWGHRIPAWYGPDGAVFVAEDAAGATALARAHYGRDETLAQDEDVLDTWFSSALWPFSTLGWPEATPEVARYYPGDVLVTGFDIIFFWVARMMMMGLHFMGDVPFRTVVIHGLVRDERGQKMSKSRGNVVDPLRLIEDYGADALRFAVCSSAGAGRDIKLGAAKVETNRAFVTKLWNAARFLEMNGVFPAPEFDASSAGAALNRWLLDAARAATAEATAALESYRFADYAACGYRFTWNVLCDWFLELAKPVLNGADAAAVAELRATAGYVFGVVLRLLHPAMPFVTEELWDSLGYGAPGSLIAAPWPEPADVADAAEARAEIDWLVRLISEVRAVRSEMNIAPGVLTDILLRGATPATLDRAARWIEPIRRMARARDVRAHDGDIPAGSAQLAVGEATVALPLAGIIDLDAERARLARDRAKAEQEADKVARKLDNAEFVARAPEEIVEENRERLRGFRDEIARIEAALARVS